MPFSTDLIQPAVERYRRERDRYIKLADRVAEICRTDVCEQNALRAHVTFRVKTQKSFEGKLRRFASMEKKNYASTDEIFSDISDFAGVRIAAYQHEDCDRIVEKIKGIFKGRFGEIEIDVKDKQKEGGENYYRAIHIQACLPDEELVGIYDNVDDISCEVQVCSMMAHVWNEIEHDIGYKPELGNPSETEKEFLHLLGETVRTGDRQISRLLDANSKRSLASQERNVEVSMSQPFRDMYDFVSRMQDFHEGTMPSFADNSGQLFEMLEDLELKTPAALEAALDPFEISALQKEAMEFNAFLEKEGVAQLSLNAESSDLMLLRLFAAHLPRILELNKGRFGRGRGRAPRLHRLAIRYHNWKDQKPTTSSPREEQPAT